MIKKQVTIKTNCKIEMIDITASINDFVKENKIIFGHITVFVPHTTAGITINENCDPDVQYDLNAAIQTIFTNINIKHFEGNSQAHLLSSLIGVSQDIFIDDNKLLLGRWQGVYFWEFDGPRTRQFNIFYEG
ncbi:MAG TPA: secondary thiamine-phosphate synthase enzyme YjbQ [Candidatus Cloacimonadota bacterium]|jgi:secondary thiamine-phosphate synthase enzyme|nr:secondary thiamine-phosphate synthase enzyme YjbQ [Candidatus Cloacimonadales bacterium]HPY95634.1 secondary thiamine-phosphate synthase enzyme YjbQ [Candidatus Cloacimonadota bacterium]HQB40864.1 secondary thiamine-phosphate synthase enzyme YjbQ [Candidatus Cloacimonadota bacterium]